MNNQMPQALQAANEIADQFEKGFFDQRMISDVAGIIAKHFAASQTCVAKPELPQPMKMLAMELRGVIIDTEQGHGFDAICLETVKRVHDQISAYSTAPTVELPEGLVAYERSSHCITYTEDDLRAYGDECARAALSASGQTAQAAMPSPFEDSTRIEDLIHANQNMHLAMQEQSELVCSLTRELNEMKLRASFAALPVDKRVLVDSAPQPSQVASEPAIDLKMLAMELLGVIIDAEQGHGFDAVCLETVKRVHDQLAAASQPKPE